MILLLIVTLLTSQVAPPPTNLQVRWISNTYAELTWTQNSDAGIFCISKNAFGQFVFYGCFTSSTGPKRFLLPPFQQNDAAYFPDPGDQYFLEEYFNLPEPKYGIYRFPLLGPKLKWVYLPIVKKQ